MFACANKLVTLLSVKHKVKLWNWLHLESLGNLTIIVRLNCAKDNMLVLISTGSTLIGRLKPHTRSASWWPEINHYTMVVSNDCLKLHQRADLTNFTKLGCGRLRCLSIGLTSCALTIVPLHLLHELLHGGVVCHLLIHLTLAWLSFLIVSGPTHLQRESCCFVIEELVCTQSKTFLHINKHRCNLLA